MNNNIKQIAIQTGLVFEDVESGVLMTPYVEDTDITGILESFVELLMNSYVDEQIKLLKAMREAAEELASYTSYAEIVGGVKHNRDVIRKWCDRVYEIKRELRDLEDD